MCSRIQRKIETKCEEKWKNNNNKKNNVTSGTEKYMK